MQAHRDEGNIVESEAEKRIRFDAKNHRGAYIVSRRAFAGGDRETRSCVSADLWLSVRLWRNKDRRCEQFAPHINVFGDFLKEVFAYFYRVFLHCDSELRSR